MRNPDAKVGFKGTLALFAAFFDILGKYRKNIVWLLYVSFHMFSVPAVNMAQSNIFLFSTIIIFFLFVQSLDKGSIQIMKQKLSHACFSEASSPRISFNCSSFT